jgi:hypothetical protein
MRRVALNRANLFGSQQPLRCEPGERFLAARVSPLGFGGHEISFYLTSDRRAHLFWPHSFSLLSSRLRKPSASSERGRTMSDIQWTRRCSPRQPLCILAPLHNSFLFSESSRAKLFFTTRIIQPVDGIACYFSCHSRECCRMIKAVRCKYILLPA